MRRTTRPDAFHHGRRAAHLAAWLAATLLAVQAACSMTPIPVAAQGIGRGDPAGRSPAAAAARCTGSVAPLARAAAVDPS